MRLFSSERTEDYIKEIKSKIEREIEELSEEKITTESIDEWVNYFVSEYQIDIISLEQKKVQMYAEQTEIETNNRLRTTPYEKADFFIDGYKITFKIPFLGGSKLFYLKPSACIMGDFEVDKLVPPKANETGYLYYSWKYSKECLDGQENLKEYVDEDFKNRFNNYLKMIEYVNTDLMDFNSGIEKFIRDKLELKKNKYIELNNIKKALKIPIHLKEDGPNIEPISLKEVKKIQRPNPKSTFEEQEYCISDFDYNNILKIIHNACSAMENTAKTFNKNTEEELRDFIISTLGTHYVNDVTGETFRRNGKTDIHIIFENKSAFIGECKIWHGIKKFENAIKQVFDYSTWKDTKISLIVFNKANKDFQSILNSIDSWIKKNTKQSKKENSNTWKCLMYRENTNSDIQIAIQVYDISI